MSVTDVFDRHQGTHILQVRQNRHVPVHVLGVFTHDIHDSVKVVGGSTIVSFQGDVRLDKLVFEHKS